MTGFLLLSLSLSGSVNAFQLCFDSIKSLVALKSLFLASSQKFLCDQNFYINDFSMLINGYFSS